MVCNNRREYVDRSARPWTACWPLQHLTKLRPLALDHRLGQRLRGRVGVEHFLGDVDRQLGVDAALSAGEQEVGKRKDAESVKGMLERGREKRNANTLASL